MERMPRLRISSPSAFSPKLDILYQALAAPVALGREVDDELRIRERPRLEHEHLARGCASSRAQAAARSWSANSPSSRRPHGSHLVLN